MKWIQTTTLDNNTKTINKMNKKYKMKYKNFCDLLNRDIESIVLTNEHIDKLNKIEKTNYNESNHREILNFYVGEIVDINKVKYDINIKYEK